MAIPPQSRHSFSSGPPMTDGLIKIHFNLEPSEWHSTTVESLWARKLPVDDGTLVFELQNAPFDAFGVSYLDIVRAVEMDGALFFASVALPGGHSTYRLLVTWPSPAFDAAWAGLSQHGCTYESGNSGGRKLFSVDVPPAAGIHEVYRLLEAGEAQGVWTFEEGHCGHSLTDSHGEQSPSQSLG